MFIEHHHPADLAEALQLLQREAPPTVPLAGGVYLKQSEHTDLAVVDLQDLGLDAVTARGVNFEIGAMVRLAHLLEVATLGSKLKEGLVLEAPEERRLQSTLGGTLVVADGRSPLVTLLLAADARLTLEPGSEEYFLGDFLPFRKDVLAGRLITQVKVAGNVALAYRYQVREGALLPAVSAAVARWPSGRTRVALGGYGPEPILAFDSPEDSGVAYAVEDAFSRAVDPLHPTEGLQQTAVALALEGLAVLIDK